MLCKCGNSFPSELGKYGCPHCHGDAMNNKPTHGGPGRGGGRKPITEAGTQRVTVTLDPATIERAKEIGAGNVSAGIRAAVAAHPATVR